MIKHYSLVLFALLIRLNAADAQSDCSKVCGKNFLSNSDFEQGLTGYYSPMQVVTDKSELFLCGGNCAIDTSSIPYSGFDNNGSIWETAQDHTTGHGNFMMANPPCVSDEITLHRPVNVTANTLYSFSIYCSNLSSSNNLPLVALRVATTFSADKAPTDALFVTAPTPIVFDAANKWQKVCGTYLATETALVDLIVEIQASVDGVSGADVGLDDFGFFENGLVSSNDSSFLSPVVCERYTSPANNIYTNTGTYRETIPTSNGCDSIITINLTVNKTKTAAIDTTVCKQYIPPSGKFKYTQSGIYKDTISTKSGCDSIITIQLTVASSNSTKTVQACKAYTVPSGRYTYTTSGTYKDTLTNALGCDSIILIDLSILSETRRSIQQRSCEKYTLPSGKQTLTKSGLYSDTLINANGCDSILSIDLTIGKSYQQAIQAEACKQYIAPDHKIHTASGSYTSFLKTTLGCDSTITVQLLIHELDTTVEINPSLVQLSSIEPAASYQWIDCETGKAIDAQTQQSFIPTKSGYYGLILSKNGCTDTSGCKYLKIALPCEGSLDSQYPNPTSNLTHITFEHTTEHVAIRLYDVLGRLVFENRDWSGCSFSYDLSHLATGSYYFVFRGEGIYRVFNVQKI